ncbi:putative RNA methyltransferase [Oceanobacillus alkalisoli]|uniref:putative RNA methyltransferase n=1 Tax=Oceanobacillus alkalisoli TaxID=2925113 RepID=UPI001F11FB99|nr:methyltransferase domain-containing protein [Oceanobacillus alkalisoli]MCF3944991.1 methyltransferase domain-containing protein [Oceanobacillus alkalisoli]
MSRKENAASLVQDYAEVFICPVCGDTVEVVELKSVVCPKRHTFDFAKQGYINISTRSMKVNYDKELFAARENIIMKHKLYDPLHTRLLEVIKVEAANNPRSLLLDAGAGEGSHLAKILDQMKTVTGIGIDISKEGIRLAASKSEKAMWLVGDLANIPVKDQSLHTIINILSPANYQEFKRVLIENGLMIKVVPGANYLIELRDTILEEQKRFFTNEETISLFKQHYSDVQIEELTYTKELHQEELRDLIKMSPLSWNAEQESINEVRNREHFGITIDLAILIGKNR